MGIEQEIGTGGKDREEMKHQFMGTVGATLPVFIIRDKEELEIRDRWMKITNRAINNSFIIGHPDNGKIGYGTIGDFRSAAVLQRVVQAENVYREWFYDNTFNATAVTTANWDTTNHRLAFTAGQIAQSLGIYYNQTNVVQGLLNASYSGTVAFWLSANTGNTWESVNSGTQHTFTTTGQDLRWKASASTSATINSLTVEAGI